MNFLEVFQSINGILIAVIGGIFTYVYNKRKMSEEQFQRDIETEQSDINTIFNLIQKSDNSIVREDMLVAIAATPTQKNLAVHLAEIYAVSNIPEQPDEAISALKRMSRILETRDLSVKALDRLYSTDMRMGKHVFEVIAPPRFTYLLSDFIVLLAIYESVDDSVDKHKEMAFTNAVSIGKQIIASIDFDMLDVYIKHIWIRASKEDAIRRQEDTSKQSYWPKDIFFSGDTNNNTHFRNGFICVQEHLYKSVFSDDEQTRDFITNYLKQKLNTWYDDYRGKDILTANTISETVYSIFSEQRFKKQIRNFVNLIESDVNQSRDDLQILEGILSLSLITINAFGVDINEDISGAGCATAITLCGLNLRE